MRVLVTRPLPSAARTAARLREAGHEPILLPVTQAHHDPEHAFAALARNPAPLAMTSAETIRGLLRAPARLAPHLSRRLYAVGSATAQAAATAGFVDIRWSEGDGAALAAAMARAGETEALYLAGNPRAAGFEARAEALGLVVELVEAYRMARCEPPAPLLDEIAHQGFEAVLFYSAETARAFFALAALSRLEPWLDQAKILCLSANIALAVPAELATFTAENPDEDSLFALLPKPGIAQI